MIKNLSLGHVVSQLQHTWLVQNQIVSMLINHSLIIFTAVSSLCIPGEESEGACGRVRGVHDVALGVDHVRSVRVRDRHRTTSGDGIVSH